MHRINKTFLLGGILAAVSVFITGCIFRATIIDDGERMESTSQENEYDNTSEIGNSYNAYLYSTGALNEVVSADSFGYAVSKYTNNADRRLEVGKFIPVDVKLSASNYEEYIDWMDSKVILYTYTDLYNLENAYKNINLYQDQIVSQKYLHTEWITDLTKLPTVEQVYNKIVKNSNEYLNSHKGYFALDSKDVKYIAEILVHMLSDYYDELSKKEISRIYCMLNDVKAVGIDSTDFTVNELKTLYNARVTDDGVIMLDTEMMENLRGNQTLERTIAHEVAHLFQRMCPDHKITGLTQIGNSQYVEDFDNTGEVNSLHFQWLYEAAAELMSMNEFDAKTPLVYKNMVGYLNTLNLITLIRPNYDEKSIVASQMSTEADAIYEVFGTRTQEEQEEIAYMLYSICYIQTEREDFKAAYEKKYGAIDGQEITVKKIMKESIAQTMTKYFYKNLAECVKDGGVVLQDIFYLINTFEAALSLHIVYDEAERQEYTDEAIAFYVEAQDKFFAMIAADSGLTFENVLDGFEQYSLIIKTDKGYERNYQFSWLEQDEKDYVGTVLTTNMQSLTENIRAFVK